MVDVEVRRYGLETKVAELARRLALPVATCFMGRGLLAESDAALVGTYMGVAGLPEVTQLVENSDGLFLLGVILSDTNFAVSERRSTCARPSSPAMASAAGLSRLSADPAGGAG